MRIPETFKRTRSASLAFFLLVISMTALGQSDSITVTHAKWHVKKIAPGIRLKQYWFNTLFHSNQNISILEIKVNRRNHIDLGVDPRELKTTSSFGKELGALAAVNGTFFDMKNGGSVDFIRSNDSVINKNRLLRDDQRALHQKAAIVIDHNEVRIEKWDGSPSWEENLKGSDVMLTGPLLIQGASRVGLDSTAMYTLRHPRTAVAKRGRKIFLITVDGRNNKAAGMSLYELADLMKWLKADDAVNLDGGGSTTLWVRGLPDEGVVNHPSDNKKAVKSKDYKPGMDPDNLPADYEKWDHGGERRVANVILVTRG